MDIWRGIKEWFHKLTLMAFVVLLLAVTVALLLPEFPWSDGWRSAAAASLCGFLVGGGEISRRYRDEPLRAIASPFGVLYCCFNALISLVAWMVLARYPETFGGVTGDRVLMAIAAGFGGAAVMRSKIAVLKGADDKELAIGPDMVISALLELLDKFIDRARAERRQEIVADSLVQMERLGDFRCASDRLLVSLFAFQNLDPERRKELTDMRDQYVDNDDLSEDVKFRAFGFAYLTLVGEEHFTHLLKGAGTEPPVSTVPPPRHS